MGSLGVFESISVDGFFTDAKNGLDWAHRGPDPEFDEFVAGNARNADGTIVFGRVTYEMMASWWPTAEAKKAMPDVARGMNAAKKLVFSRSMKSASWENTTLSTRPPVDEIRDRKKKGDLVVLGSGSLVSQLTDAGLVDGLQLVVVPVVLGKGRTLFESVKKPVNLRCTKTRAFTNGNVVLWYEPAR
jgi:dihydrofolate reductase